MRRAPALLLLPALLLGCSSEQPTPAAAPPPPTDVAPAPPQVTATGADDRPRARRTPPDHVAFRFEQADLATEVLPAFDRQVGVRITWAGDPRQVTLRLTQPMLWTDALELVCQFSGTHPARDYQGELHLKDGWGGSLGSDAEVAELLSEQARDAEVSRTEWRRGARARRAGWPGGDVSASGDRRPSRGRGVTSPADRRPTGAYSGGQEANDLLNGVSRTSSGRR